MNDAYLHLYRSYAAGLTSPLAYTSWRDLYLAGISDGRGREHPDYLAFRDWMRDNKGGSRECPAGMFPSNFAFWLAGGRW